MKKILLWILLILSITFSSISHANIDQNALEKELVLSRYDVTKFYGNDIHTNIDNFFIKLLSTKNSNQLEDIYTLTSKYMENKNTEYLNKQEILIKYLLVRSYYELNYRMK